MASENEDSKLHAETVSGRVVVSADVGIRIIESLSQLLWRVKERACNRRSPAFLRGPSVTIVSSLSPGRRETPQSFEQGRFNMNIKSCKERDDGWASKR